MPRIVSICGLLIAWLCSAALAQPAGPTPKATVDAALNVSALQPGKPAILAIVVDIKPGFHTQSHTPSDPNFIALEVSVSVDKSIQAMAPIDPPGKDEQYPALGRLNVYTGRAIVYVPIQVNADATPGDAHLSGTVTYQACNDSSCFPPQKPKFAIDARIVPADEKVTPSRPELFEGYKPPSTRPATTQTAATPRAIRRAFSPPRPPGADWPAPLALGAALLAGLLFNIMPCVLPVLPLKVIGFYEVAQHRRSKSFLLGLVFGAGIIAVFAVLSVLVIILHRIDWGGFFHQGWFVWMVAAFLLLMALGLFGTFEISLPTAIYRFTPRHDTYTGNFLFGGLTAIIATPCTAPLLTPVLGFATAIRPAGLGALAVVVVGVGMAIPYLVLSAVPEVARRFPRTGPAASLFKQMMGFMLLAAAVYFAGGQVVHGTGFWWLVWGVVVIAAIYLVARTLQLTARQKPIAAAALVAVAMVGGMFWWTLLVTGVLLPRPTPLATAAGTTQPATARWVAYSPERFERELAAEKIVLVKFTANWCATCQVIEGTVYGDPAVWQAMEKLGVVAMKVDLTHDEENDPGHALLLSLNPAGGIPLTAIYSPNLDAPIQLSSFYTAGDLYKSLQEAAAATAAAR